ncbi:NUDIX domain-containing protein [Microvirga massiliensis]|uniref:NUDIX domain-containing protein n=1 Tax=Microvirga massiliensis TaxID=1033741 RepID=UPI00062B4E87|nr:NUDIX domain-containing protein [Microvirga massiliensis]
MPKRSAGLVLYRIRSSELQVLLVHPGGPYFAKKDAGAWSIPKGEYGDGEDPQAAALREFEEETGVRPSGSAVFIGEIRQSGGKRVMAFAVEGDLDPAIIRSNQFEMEWPPRSGRRQSFPEIDEARWFGLEEARIKILVGQAPLLDRLCETVPIP